MTDKAREALAELVALKDLRKSLAQANDRFTRFRTDKSYAVVAKLETDLWRRDPLAWSAARAALAEPSQPERSTKYSDEPWQDALLERAKAAGFRYDGQSLWEASLYTNELLALLSPAEPSQPPEPREPVAWAGAALANKIDALIERKMFKGWAVDSSALSPDEVNFLLDDISNEIRECFKEATK